MQEAQPIDKGYSIIFEVAKLIEKETKLTSSSNLDEVINRMGGTINYYDYGKVAQPRLVEIIGQHNFKVYLLNGLDKDFKKLLLIQSLGHYILHGHSGVNPCYVSASINNKAYQEGFIFTLAVLIPDELFLKVYKTNDTKYLASLFRVPEFAIESKKKVITKIYLNKE